MWMMGKEAIPRWWRGTLLWCAVAVDRLWTQQMCLQRLAGGACGHMLLAAVILRVQSRFEAPRREPQALTVRPIHSVFLFSSRNIWNRDWLNYELFYFLSVLRAPYSQENQALNEKVDVWFSFYLGMENRKGMNEMTKSHDVRWSTCRRGSEHPSFHWYRLLCSHKGRQRPYCLNFFSRTAEHLHLLNFLQDS